MDPRFVEAFRRARLGDPRAFRRLVEKLGREMVTYVSTLLGGDVHTAHDLAQEVLVRAWDELGSMRNALHLRRWCYHVARCKVVSWRRRQMPGGRKVESLDVVRRDGGQCLYAAEAAPPPAEPDALLLALRAALRRLPAKYLGPVHLHYVQGLDTRETARLLGIRRQAVKMRLHRARALLKRNLRNGASAGAAAPGDAAGAPPPGRAPKDLSRRQDP